MLLLRKVNFTYDVKGRQIIVVAVFKVLYFWAVTRWSTARERHILNARAQEK